MQEKKEVSLLSIRILRILLSGIFIAAGINHIKAPESIAERTAITPLGAYLEPIGLEFLVIASGVLMLLAGIAFLIGFYTRYAACILCILLIPITIIIQTNGGLMHGPFWKNIAILGGLLFFMLNPPLDNNKINL